MLPSMTTVRISHDGKAPDMMSINYFKNYGKKRFDRPFSGAFRCRSSGLVVPG